MSVLILTLKYAIMEARNWELEYLVEDYVFVVKWKWVILRAEFVELYVSEATEHHCEGFGINRICFGFSNHLSFSEKIGLRRIENG